MKKLSEVEYFYLTMLEYFSYIKFLITKIIPPSPISETFTKYGDYPVDLSRGLVNISVPLYEIKVADINVPVTLSYHASGIKFTDEDFPCGLGWSLNVGGRISRTIRGAEDEKSMLEKVKPANQMEQM